MRFKLLMIIYALVALNCGAQVSTNYKQIGTLFIRSLDTIKKYNNGENWKVTKLETLMDSDKSPRILAVKRHGYLYPYQVDGKTEKAKAVKILDLSNNNLTGELPDNAFMYYTSRGLYGEEADLIFSYNKLSTLTKSKMMFGGLQMGKNTVALDHNELTKVSFEIQDGNLLSGTKYLYLQHNNLRYLTLSDMGKYSDYLRTVSPYGGEVRVDNNYLDFQDIIPLKSAVKAQGQKPMYDSYDIGFTCSPQKHIGDEVVDKTLERGQSTSLNYTLRHSDNKYSWTLNGKDVPLSDAKKLDISNMDETKAGVYKCKITNPNLPELTLYSVGMPVWLKKEGNNSPSEIELDTKNLCKLFTGAIVADISGVDPDDDQLYFRLTNHNGDNGSFRILDGKTLTASEELFFREYKQSYTITIQAYDIYGGTFDKEFTISYDPSTEGSEDLIPKDIILSANEVKENEVRKYIGKLSADGVESGLTKYRLIENVVDNGEFFISNDSLFTNTYLNFEKKQRYSVRVELYYHDSEITFIKDFEILVEDTNDNPDKVLLSGNTITENLQPGTTVGYIMATDEDPADLTFEFELVSGSGDADNNDFVIQGNILKSNTIFKSSDIGEKSVRVRATDKNGGYCEKVLKISVVAEELPEDAMKIEISNCKVPENCDENTMVGELSVLNSGSNSFIYNLESGFSDNPWFEIVNNNLNIVMSPDFEQKSEYNIKIKAVSGDIVLTKDIQVLVTNVNEAPYDLGLYNTVLKSSTEQIEFVSLISCKDPDGYRGSVFDFVEDATCMNSCFKISKDSLFYINNNDNDLPNEFFIKISVTDIGGEVCEKKITMLNIEGVDNSAPTAIGVNNFILDREWEEGEFVSLLFSKDKNENSFNLFSLVEENDTDYDYFEVRRDSLFLKKNLSGTNKKVFKVNIKATDSENMSYKHNFVFYIPDQVNNNIIIGTDIKMILKPNMISSEATLEIESEYSGELNVTIFDQSGKVMSTEIYQKNSGIFSKSINLEGMNTGFYILEAQVGIRKQKIKFFKD